MSQTLSRPRQINCVKHRQLLAVYRPIKQFYRYLYGQQFTALSDYSTLQWLLHFTHPEGQVARWLEVLQSYNFTIQHWPGLKHGNADALSQQPCLAADCRQSESKEIQEAEPRLQCQVQVVTLVDNITTEGVTCKLS